ncbi:MAG: hypothetical protein KAG66_11665 [Methylococcales bacterium]|nr:hypothetical protein [Methylococcales bacterium]
MALSGESVFLEDRRSPQKFPVLMPLYLYGKSGFLGDRSPPKFPVLLLLALFGKSGFLEDRSGELLWLSKTLGRPRLLVERQGTLKKRL